MRSQAVMTHWIRTIMSVMLLWGGLLDSADAQFLQTLTPPVPLMTSEPLATSGPPEQSAASVQALVMGESGVIYAGSFGYGIFRTEDRGATWLPVGGGVTDPFILSLASAKDGSIYAGTFRGGVFRSRDAGQTWQPVNSGLKRLEVKALMAVEHELYAGTGDGVYHLHGSEDHWTPVTAGLDDILVHALARSADGTLFAGTSGKGVFRFSPRSAGWVRMHQGLKDHEGMIENFIRVLVIDQDQSIFAGTFDGGVFRSADGGLTWRPISRALPNDSIRGIVFSDRALVVATGNGIFKTVDKGRQWIPMNKGLTNLAVQVLIGSGDKGLYVGTSSGVFRSDDGVSWIAINQGLEAGIAPPPFLFR
jgi:ligand-binding sensor domain-containing protein